jgi:hypothetical protein
MTLLTSRVIVRAEMLLAFERIISKEKTRHYLNGVHIKPHSRAGVIVCATDGHRLAAVHAVDAIFSGNAEIWNLDWKGTIMKAMQTFKESELPKKPCYVSASSLKLNFYVDLSYSSGNCSVSLFYAESAADVDNAGGILVIQQRSKCRIDGTFPAYRRAIPSDCTTEGFVPTWFNAKYVNDCSAFGADIATALERGSRAMTILSADAAAPALIRYDGMPEAFMVLMPMRDSGAINDLDRNGIPAWLDDLGEDQVVACEIPPRPEALYTEAEPVQKDELAEAA